MLGDPVAGSGVILFENWTLPCGSVQPGCSPTPQQSGKLFRIDGTSATQISASAGALIPLSADAGRVLVYHENGALEIDRNDGSQVVSFTVGPPLRAADGSYPPIAGCLEGNDAVVLENGILADYNATTGALLGTHLLPLGTLDGCANGIAATASTNAITLTRLADGANATITAGDLDSPRSDAPPNLPVAAQLNTTGLFYSWNTNDPAYPGHVTYIPYNQLPLH
jgi:hypothetical protein